MDIFISFDLVLYIFLNVLTMGTDFLKQTYQLCLPVAKAIQLLTGIRKGPSYAHRLKEQKSKVYRIQLQE